MQLRISKSISFFEKMLRNKLNFEKYVRTDTPTLFFGVYRHNDFVALEKHTGKKIVWFAGTDALMMLDSYRKGQIDVNRYFKDVIVVAESKWIEKDLDEMGIKYRSISLFIDGLYNWRVEPLGESLYWYGGRNSKYGKQYFDYIQKAIPDLNIIVHDQGDIPHEQMKEVYSKCFAGIRPVGHDGLSQTVGEMGLMGRMSIWNGNGPFSVHYENENDIVAAIKKLRKGYNPKITSKRTRGYFLENEAKLADLFLEVDGFNGIECMKVFEEFRGRCGSIFRIQRTDDIKKIGGLGDSQYQRPWLSAQMQKMGKKELLVSKISGYMAGEWKNVDKKKGFPEGVDFNTKDRGTI